MVPSASRSARLDPDLLEPSLMDYPGKAGVPGERPWRPRSLVWVAFFGGVGATVYIHWRNAQRLRAEALLRRTLVLGAAALALAFLVGGYAHAQGAEPRSVRLITRGVALGLHLVYAGMQKPADRVYVATGGEYDSLWKPGLIAVFGIGLVEGLLGLLLAALVWS